MNLEKLNEALNDFNKAIELNSTFKQTYEFRTVIFSKLGLPDLAIKDLYYLATIDPKYNKIYRDRWNEMQKNNN
jgi:tetratricopeptide (TPR) repeat protein